jgi:hypothetical protein
MYEDVFFKTITALECLCIMQNALDGIVDVTHMVFGTESMCYWRNCGLWFESYFDEQTMSIIWVLHIKLSLFDTIVKEFSFFFVVLSPIVF